MRFPLQEPALVTQVTASRARHHRGCFASRWCRAEAFRPPALSLPQPGLAMSIKYAARIGAAMCALLIGARAVRAEQDLTPTAAFEKRLEGAIRATEASPRMHGMSYLQRRAIIEFVAGNMLFTLLHE